MARPRVIKKPNGDVEVVIKLSPSTWKTLESVGEHIVGKLLSTGSDRVWPGGIGLTLLADHLHSEASAGRLEPALLQTIAIVQIVDSSPSGPSSDFYQIPYHQDPKRSSGYYNVFARGNAYEIRVRHPQTNAVMTIERSFKTPIEAARARYDYYYRNKGLAYGAAELECENLRKTDPSMLGRTDLEIWPEVLDHVSRINMMHVFADPAMPSLVPGERGEYGKPATIVGDRTLDRALDESTIQAINSFTPSFDLANAPSRPATDEAASDRPRKRPPGRPRNPCKICGSRDKPYKDPETKEAFHVDLDGELTPCRKWPEVSLFARSTS